MWKKLSHHSTVTPIVPDCIKHHSAVQFFPLFSINRDSRPHGPDTSLATALL